MDILSDVCNPGKNVLYPRPMWLKPTALVADTKHPRLVFTHLILFAAYANQAFSATCPVRKQEKLSALITNIREMFKHVP